jgi:hypothetical protein
MKSCKGCIHFSICCLRHFEGRRCERFKQGWISVEDELPEENKYVLIWVGEVQVARIEKGITEEDRDKMRKGEIEDKIECGWSLPTGTMPSKRSEIYKECDVRWNNLVPYCWKANGGPMSWFGQDVTHWRPLPENPSKEAEG